MINSISQMKCSNFLKTIISQKAHRNKYLKDLLIYSSLKKFLPSKVQIQITQTVYSILPNFKIILQSFRGQKKRQNALYMIAYNISSICQVTNPDKDIKVREIQKSISLRNGCEYVRKKNQQMNLVIYENNKISLTREIY